MPSSAVASGEAKFISHPQTRTANCAKRLISCLYTNFIHAGEITARPASYSFSHTELECYANSYLQGKNFKIEGACGTDALWPGDYFCYKEEGLCYDIDLETWEDNISSYDGSMIEKQAGIADPVGGSVTAPENVINPKDIQYLPGEDGQTGREIVPGTMRRGGKGGKSGIGSLGGCGGYSSSIRVDGITYPADGDCMQGGAYDGGSAIFNVLESDILSGAYGVAGAGGGGGSWYASVGAQADKHGVGGKGAPGYVYVWWTKPN